VDAANYINLQQGSFRITENARYRDFYRLRKVGSPRLYVIGDSISTPGAWPTPLANTTGRHTFSQAIGGTSSPSMVGRTRGVELYYPVTNPTIAATIRMKWQRHIADRTQDPARRAEWAYYAKSVSEPTSIEIYQHGRFIGLAQRNLRNFTTAHAINPKQIRCPGHGLTNGERVTFISNDPAYPGDLSVTSLRSAWEFTSSHLPPAVVDRRVYFAANVTDDTFEIKEFIGDTASLNLGGDATGNPAAECGWSFDVSHTGETWDITWAARTKFDDCIWLLEVSANDMPGADVATWTIPNNLLLIKQMIEIKPRFLIVCPIAGSFVDRGPGSWSWTNYYVNYMSWVYANYPDNHIDTMAVFDTLRSAKEKGFLTDPATPEKLWISGQPTNEATWVAYRVDTVGAHETWVGPGYLPLQYRTGSTFSDDIHPNTYGNQIIANAVAAKIAAKGW
jgi:hypothetical protein